MPDAGAVFGQLAAWPGCLFLDSALKHAQLGRYSFVTADPFAWIEQDAVETDGGDAFARVRQAIAPFGAATRDDLPPFQGGAAGLFGYDLSRQLERLPAPRADEFGLPPLAMGLYDVVVAFDHVERRAWIVSQGFPEMEPARRQARAGERLAAFKQQLVAPSPARPHCATRSIERLPASALARQVDVAAWPGVTSNFSRGDYLRAVERAIEYIRAGDIFQVNLSQRLLTPARDDAVSLYLRLRERNPATFAAFFDAGSFQVASASPERFVKVRGGQVETRPIKGTRGRMRSPEADLFIGDELAASEKDRAENVMIVDLLRNDLSRTCRAESVRVTELCQIETYQFVQHLVSAVVGELDEGRTALDVLRAAFPGGSITGAPKVRAMEIIAELEPTARGAYCGALGYVGFDGAMDTNLLIRTVTAARGWWQAPVGGGIVAQSRAEREYEETWEKAEGILRAFY